ncbi:MAG TPA: hypothetical protein P5026_07150 [Kiritimatiellia bacterium]|nr:hypothetical protein [Kiritimatiellia bacterium]HRU70375.1 hypothetical protein [Kiritimatiellia bacterium]
MTPVRELERRSAAVTLSDMEIFVFPELMYSLVLANIMSPRIWRWRDDPWFKGVRKMKPYRRLQRLKQYIMDHYVFNLDLETWGLTSQQRELARFSPFLSPEVIAQSNALFGYQGDSYYFDIDIRTHFGLDKYGADVIPYWKTETVEAMDAFQYRAGYTTGAGECVSLAALYAAALYVVAGIPLEKVFLMATPLHSQNFVDVDDGVLINNRRLVTKAMWFNGTQISGQARRALENERVTIVSHLSGWIHTLYQQATIDPTAYGGFAERLRAYLTTRLTPEILGNFLRQNPRCRKCFVLRWPIHGVDRYITLDQAFSFEQDSAYKVTDRTREKLLATIPPETFAASCCPCKIVLNDIEAFVQERSIDLCDPDDLQALRERIGDACMSGAEMVEQLVRFCHTEPRLPSTEVRFEPEGAPLALSVDMTRDEVIAHVESLRTRNVTADMAFYAWRDLARTPAAPFIKAAMERNPVSATALAGVPDEEVVARVAAMPNESIYDEDTRLAQPDEVWNFGRGDGFEKALLVANVARSRGAGALRLTLADGEAVLTDAEGGERCRFPAGKRPAETRWML